MDMLYSSAYVLISRMHYWSFTFVIYMYSYRRELMYVDLFVLLLSDDFHCHNNCRCG